MSKDRQKLIVWSGIAGVATLLFLACIWKYELFLYNGIDLAYFNQVFWNTVRGRFFEQTIHPHLSLGDHAEFAILALAPLYSLWQDPRMLLAMQATAVTLPAWPLWLLAQRRLAGRGQTGAMAPLLVAAVWLCNPFVHNIALFEFHMLPFALFPLLMAMVAYEDAAKRRFVAWILIAMLVREDVALVVALIGLLAWIEKRPLWWRILPVFLGGLWFLIAMRIIGTFSPGGSYKFGVYYEWLGSGPLGMLAGAVTHPMRLIAHVLTLANFEMLLGFFLPMLFLPLLRPKRLVLFLAPLAQILLGAPGGGEIVLQTHYSTLFLPALALAFVDGLGVAPDMVSRLAKIASRNEARLGMFALVAITSVYAAIVLGPLPTIAQRAFLGSDAGRTAERRAASAREIVAAVPESESVAASYALLPALSSRERLTSLHYVFLGVTQFGGNSYVPPVDTRFVALDVDDLLTYRTQFLATAWAAPHYAGGTGRLVNFVTGTTLQRPPFVIYDRENAVFGDSAPYAFIPDKTEARMVRVEGAKYLVVNKQITLDGESSESILRVEMQMPDGRIISQEQALLAPPPFTVRQNVSAATATIALRLLPDETEPTHVTVSLLRQEATYVLDGVRSAVRLVTSEKVLEKTTLKVEPLE